jgi:hypothetical protein
MKPLRLVLFVLAGAAGACTEPASPLTRAAAANDAAAIAQLLDAGALIDDPRAPGPTPLIAAARRGAVEALRALLAAGANPNRPAPSGPRWSPIQHAIQARQPAALRVLLEGGANPDLKTGDSLPILLAAADGDPAFVELLLAHGANPRGDGRNGQNVMSAAVSGGAFQDINRPLLGGCHAQTVRALLARDPGLRPQPEARALARMNGCAEVLRLIERAGGSTGR